MIWLLNPWVVYVYLVVGVVIVLATQSSVRFYLQPLEYRLGLWASFLGMALIICLWPVWFLALLFLHVIGSLLDDRESFDGEGG